MGPWCQPLSFLPLKQPILTIPVYPSRDSPYLYQQSASSSSETGINLTPSRQNLPTPQLTVQNSKKVSRLTHRCSKPFLSNAPWRVRHARTETNPTDHTEKPKPHDSGFLRTRNTNTKRYRGTHPWPSLADNSLHTVIHLYEKSHAGFTFPHLTVPPVLNTLLITSIWILMSLNDTSSLNQLKIIHCPSATITQRNPKESTYSSIWHPVAWRSMKLSNRRNKLQIMSQVVQLAQKQCTSTCMYTCI